MFTFISDWFFRMTWLYDGIAWLVEDIFGLSLDSRLGNSLHFFIYDIIKLSLLLIVLVFLVAYIQSYFPPEKSQKTLGKYKGIKGNTLGAGLGVLTPFCSCSSIPLFIGFTKAGLPLGITFSFLIASPLIDLASVILLAGIFGGQIAIAYVLSGAILAIIAGTIIENLHVEDQIASFIYERGIEAMDYDIVLTQKDRFIIAKNEVKVVYRRVWKWIIIGIGMGALIHNWIPTSLLHAVLGKDNPLAVIIAIVVGIPMYANIFGMLPVAEALLAQGIGLGTVLALMMSVTVLSLPSMLLLKEVVKPKLLMIFVSMVSIGVLIIGYLFNTIEYLF